MPRNTPNQSLIPTSPLRNKFSLYFFFSSRRRYPSSYGDWSSDVCSSDLARRGRMQDGGSGRGRRRSAARRGRSEERRGGKECRSRGARGNLKKNELRA